MTWRNDSHHFTGPGRDVETVEQVLEQIRAGQLTSGQAFMLFRTMERSVIVGAQNNTKSSDHLNRRQSKKLQADEDVERQRRLEAIMQELNGLIGLHTVKQLVLELQAFIEIQQRRKEHQLASEQTTLHMVFKGNPGTGKTTVARILGRMFREMKALPKGHLVECERADLVGEYIGHTAQRTREHIRKALGGILFVDEAYALARGGEKDFGKEAIDTLVKSMEDHKDEFVVILAGYRDEMDWFLKSNPGLQSRFPIQIDFPDYADNELLAIAELMCARRQYKLSAGARRRLLNALARSNRTPFDGNARFIRNVLERAMRRQALRLVRKRRLTRDELMTLEATDVWEAVVEARSAQEAFRSVDGTQTQLTSPFVLSRGTGLSVG